MVPRRSSFAKTRASRAVAGTLAALATICCLSALVLASLHTEILLENSEEARLEEVYSYEGRSSHKLLQSPFSKFRHRNSARLQDPYRQPGYMWWSKNVSETRWIPYDTEHLLDELPIDSTAAPPAKALSLAAPAYNKLSTTVEAPSHPDLGFMRNKHVMLSCDSHCHRITEAFCIHHQPLQSQYIFNLHNYTICKIPSLNFTISTWFHYGISEEEETYMSVLIGRQPGLHQMEARLDNFHIPNRLHIDGPPDLILFDSSFWDSDYFGSTAAQRDNNNVFPNMRQEGLSYSELAHHRRRIAQMIGHLRTRFPAAPIMWKPAHLRSKNAHTKGVQWEASGSHDLEQMNQSTRALMAKLRVPVFEWAAKLAGSGQYEDLFHWDVAGSANWLAGDMLLYYLRRSVLGLSLD